MKSRLVITAVLLVVLLAVALFVARPADAIGAVTPPSEGSALTPQFVVSMVAGVLALALEVVPGLRERWADLSWEAKRFGWLIGCVVVGSGPWVLGCIAQWFGFDLTGLVIVATCDADSFVQGLQIAFLAYFASQSVHGLSVAGLKAAGVYQRMS